MDRNMPPGAAMEIAVHEALIGKAGKDLKGGLARRVGMTDATGHRNLSNLARLDGGICMDALTTTRPACARASKVAT